MTGNIQHDPYAEAFPVQASAYTSREQVAAPPRSPLFILVMLVMGFNVGFIVPMLVVFGLLPALLPEMAPHPVRAVAALATETPVYQVITNTPTATLPPTETPPPSPTPTVEATELAAVATNTLPPATATLRPTHTNIPQSPTPTPLVLPNNYHLNGINFELQGWNNCGPANLTMALSYYDVAVRQQDVARYVKPNADDQNVTPEQMVGYIENETSMRAMYRVAGTLDTIRWLVANEFVVIAEAGYDPPDEQWYGHYFTVVGYDDGQSYLEVYDSNLGRASNPKFDIDYQDFDRRWQAFNRTFIVVYPPARENLLRQFLGSDWDVTANWNKAAEIARAEIRNNGDDQFAWFNLGTALTRLGQYTQAALAFDKARSFDLPYRFLWYQFDIYEAYLNDGRLDEAQVLAEATLRTTKYSEETHYYLGRVHESRGEINLAADQYRQAMRLNRNYWQAQQALERLGVSPSG